MKILPDLLKQVMDHCHIFCTRQLLKGHRMIWGEEHINAMLLQERWKHGVHPEWCHYFLLKQGTPLADERETISIVKQFGIGEKKKIMLWYTSFESPQIPLEEPTDSTQRPFQNPDINSYIHSFSPFHLPV